MIADYGKTSQLCIPADLRGGRKDRVWYADVKMLFKISMSTDDSDGQTLKTFDLAWIQWYEAFGVSSDRDNRVFSDPDFPAALVKHFPRLYLPEDSLGACYDVILTSNILCPAALGHDVTLTSTPASTKGKGKKGKKQRQQRQKKQGSRRSEDDDEVSLQFYC